MQKKENDYLNEQIYKLKKNLNEDVSNSNIQNVKNELIYNIKNLMKRIENENNVKTIKNDLINIYQLIIDSDSNYNDNNNFIKSKQSNYSDFSNSYNNNNNNNDSNISNQMRNNIIQEESDRNFATSEDNVKRSSYITQNYEKFKQLQENKVNNNNSSTYNKLNNNNQCKILLTVYLTCFR